MRLISVLLLVSGLSVMGCGDDEAPARDGTFTITVSGGDYAEDRIPGNVFVDGWELVFDRFVVVIGEVNAGSEAEIAGDYRIVDLAPGSDDLGHLLGSATVPGGNYNRLNLTIGPDVTATNINASEADAQSMVDDGLSLLVAGTATRGNDTYTFEWEFTERIRYQNCSLSDTRVDGAEGATAEITFHVERMFYDTLVDDETPLIAFNAVTFADANSDGDVTVGELRGYDISGETRYNVGNLDIANLFEFIEALLPAMVNVNGDAECTY